MHFCPYFSGASVPCCAVKLSLKFQWHQFRVRCIPTHFRCWNPFHNFNLFIHSKSSKSRCWHYGALLSAAAEPGSPADSLRSPLTFTLGAFVSPSLIICACATFFPLSARLTLRPCAVGFCGCAAFARRRLSPKPLRFVLPPYHQRRLSSRCDVSCVLFNPRPTRRSSGPALKAAQPA